LTFVDISDSIVFPPLAGRYRRFQKVLEPIIREPGNKRLDHNQQDSDKDREKTNKKEKKK
jgi:hypothetical protein